MKKVTDYLQEFGLTELEAMLYQGLLETGPTTIMGLAEHVGIKRITTHFNIENLITKGLVTQSIQGARRQIIAEPPERLEYLIKQKEKEVKKIRNDFSNFVQTLSSSLSPSKPGENVKVEYYEGINALKSVYLDVLSAKKIYSFVNVNQIRSVLPENPELFRKSLEINKDQEMWEIIEASKESQKLIDKANDRYHFRFVPTHVSFSEFDFMIFDNSVAMVYINPKKPYAIVSNSPAMANGLKAIHTIVWEVLSGSKTQ